MNNSPRPLLLVGIDPGASTGYATADARTGRLLSVETLSFWLCVARLDALAADDDVRVEAVVIENSKDAPVYARYGQAGRGERDRIARSVGRIDAQIDLLTERCAALGLPVELREPSRGGKMDGPTFARLTGFSGRTSQHGRDAGKLLVGRTRSVFSDP